MTESTAAARQNDAPAFAPAMTQAASFELGGLVSFVLPVVLLVVVIIPATRGAPI